MPQAKLAASAITYSAAISACAKGGQWQPALNLLSCMQLDAVLANSITLTPGTITMLIRGDIFHVHTMSQFLEDDLLEGGIERKVAEVFEPEVLKSK